MTKRSRDYLVWIDCEMTGLDPDRDVLIEIATIITTYDLDIVARGPVFAIRQPSAKLRRMDAWNRRTHRKSGLLDRIRDEGVALVEAERATLRFVKRHCYAHTAPLCGNSIGQDKAFLRKFMPQLNDFLNYRVIDVSSVKLLVRAWYGGKYEAPPKRELHRALDDIEESIAELDYYRRTIFKQR